MPATRSYALFPHVPYIRQEMRKGKKASEIKKSLQDKGIQATEHSIKNAGVGKTYSDLPNAVTPAEGHIDPFSLSSEKVNRIRHLYDSRQIELEQIAAEEGISVSWVNQIGARRARLDVPDFNPSPKLRQERFDEETVAAILQEALPFVGKRGRWSEWERIGAKHGCSSVYVYYLTKGERRPEVVQKTPRRARIKLAS